MQIRQPVLLEGLPISITGSDMDIFVIERRNVDSNAPFTERIGGFEVELAIALSKQLGFVLNVIVLLLSST